MDEWIAVTDKGEGALIPLLPTDLNGNCVTIIQGQPGSDTLEVVEVDGRVARFRMRGAGAPVEANLDLRGKQAAVNASSSTPSADCFLGAELAGHVRGILWAYSGLEDVRTAASGTLGDSLAVGIPAPTVSALRASFGPCRLFRSKDQSLLLEFRCEGLSYYLELQSYYAAVESVGNGTKAIPVEPGSSRAVTHFAGLTGISGEGNPMTLFAHHIGAEPDPTYWELVATDWDDL